MYYIVKGGSYRNGELNLTTAESNLRPLRYSTARFSPRGCTDKLATFFEYVANGNCHVQPSARISGHEIFGIACNLEKLQRMATAVDIGLDLHLNCCMTTQLNELLGKIGSSWFLKDDPTITPEDVQKVTSLNEAAIRLYAEKRAEMKERQIILVQAALYSDLFEEYDALLDENGDMLLGLRSAYDNHGHYDNSKNTAIYLVQDDEDAAYVAFSFFGSGHFPRSKEHLPEIDWNLIYQIPGHKAAELLFNSLKNH